MLPVIAVRNSERGNKLRCRLSHTDLSCRGRSSFVSGMEAGKNIRDLTKYLIDNSHDTLNFDLGNMNKIFHLKISKPAKFGSKM